MLRILLVFPAVSALALGGCAPARTRIVVVVETDLSVPGELQSVRAVVGEGACEDMRCVRDFVTDAPSSIPFSFTLEPRGATDARFTLTVTGRDARATDVVSRRVDSAFVPASTRLLVVRLERACRGIECTGQTTCLSGACVSSVVDERMLPLVIPGTELRDAAQADAGDHDASTDDVGPAVPVSCDALPGSAPSGVTRIDPDGAGGVLPFDAWCDNAGDGGGWTLLAKVDPASDVLAFDAPAWTASSAAAFGAVDETPGDALLMPYWTLPVGELRFVVQGRTLVTTMTGFRGTLRAAMDARPVFEGPASRPAPWETLVASDVRPAMPPCVRAGILPAIPEASGALRVRIGALASALADCAEPTMWFGIAPSLSTSAANCDTTTDTTAGAERVCGPAGRRSSYPQAFLVYGR